MGELAITETVGWGDFVLGGAPGVLALTAAPPKEALPIRRDMPTITHGKSLHYRMPVFGFAVAGVGIDIRKAVRCGVVTPR
jgi:hypothetical protein